MVRGALRLISLSAVLALAFTVVACGGNDDESPSDAQSDSALQAWPKAQEAVKEVADDAVLLTISSGGLAATDELDSWSFWLFSPSQNNSYLVFVEGGEAEPAFDWGQPESGMEAKPVVAVESINVGAAKAVSLAREFGEQSGTLPKYVNVNGRFAEAPGTGDAGAETGVWAVVFAKNADGKDAQQFAVDMMSGEVTAAK